MDKDTKNLIHFANRFHDILTRLHSYRYIEVLSQLTNLAGLFKSMAGDSRKLSVALSRNWLSAADNCSGSIKRLTDDVTFHISKARQLLDKPAVRVPELSFIFEELRQLRLEFNEVDLDKKADTISVFTEPVTLEDVYLGPFRIQLEMNSLPELYKNTPYYCIALDPNPAAANEEVTHPHVSGERLCEGDGFVAIRSALEQGRLVDFFNIIRSILNTYNPDSPYVSLEDWSGISCYDCGCVTGSENIYYCYYCDRDYCESCSSYCRSCDETCCLGCGGNCPNCDEFVCRNCIKTCPECGETFCKMCMEDDVCEYCKEQQEQEELENIENETDTKEDNLRVAG